MQHEVERNHLKFLLFAKIKEVQAKKKEEYLRKKYFKNINHIEKVREAITLYESGNNGKYQMFVDFLKIQYKQALKNLKK